ncbi:hypothetical protein AOQ87_00215 [Candidatus Riesia pediculischaeffi]|uniref:Na(+)/H(+) antiporter NhaA n=2 Tax=Candidatus Riesia pediculischaeffi TaxID=428411 RepID=A0A1V0HJX9_9ENTR|nr:hypothetical protein AOQ87_00215 [Candidatus Riesia pediculischaeffi]
MFLEISQKFSEMMFKFIFHLRKFLLSDLIVGLLLVISTILSLYVANSSCKDLYYDILRATISFNVWNIIKIDQSFLNWINDGLMSIFFLTVGLEIKREFSKNCSSRKRDQAIFSIFSAIGGVVVPIVIYLIFNHSNEITRKGWAIPSATDIAFVVGVISIFGDRVSKELKIFLLTLATVDDLILILIVSIFYSKSISLLYLFLSIFPVIILFLMCSCKVRNILPYLFFGIILWYFLLFSGVQATISGVIVGLMLPIDRYDDISVNVEKILRLFVNYFVLPIFAFSNSGVDFNEILSNISSTVFSTVSIGIISALVIGKPTGIFLSILLMLRLKVVNFPKRIEISQIFATSILCGISFTMSIFIAGITFDQYRYDNLLSYSRVGIFLGSWISASIGVILLQFTLPKKEQRRKMVIKQ